MVPIVSQIAATHYRNLQMAEGVSLGTLNVFIGPNGSGKSNFVRILRFLKDVLVSPRSETQRDLTAFDRAIETFGAGRILSGSLEFPHPVEFATTFTLDKGCHHCFELKLQVTDSDTVYMGEDNLYSSCDDTTDMVSDKDASYSLTRQRIADFVADWAFYDSAQMNLEAIRCANTSLQGPDGVLSAGGENLALVLRHLADNADFQRRFELAMRELFPRTRHLCFAALANGDLDLQWYLHGNERPYFLSDMSDGTVRMLCWAAVLLSPRPASLIVLDAPEAGVHPAWLRILAGWISEAARRTQVMVFTHSSDLLDYFTEDMASVYVFRPAPHTPTCARIVPVSHLNQKYLQEKLAEGWELGDLYRVGDPQLGGWPW